MPSQNPNALAKENINIRSKRVHKTDLKEGNKCEESIKASQSDIYKEKVERIALKHCLVQE